MAGTKDIKKVRIIDVEKAANEIIKEYCGGDTMTSTVIKSTLEILMLKLKGEIK